MTSFLSSKCSSLQVSGHRPISLQRLRSSLSIFDSKEFYLRCFKAIFVAETIFIGYNPALVESITLTIDKLERMFYVDQLPIGPNVNQVM